MPEFRSGLRLALWAAVAGAMAVPLNGRAMQIESVALTDGNVLLGARGPIVTGDADRLRRVIASLGSGKHLVGIALDSPGGSVEEGSRMAADIHDHYLSVIVPAQSKCASACFLLFAAGARKLVAADALIGVHSASEGGEETAMSMAVTTAMARTASVYGVPPIVLGKMVSTTPGRIEWLTPDDLALMGVKTYHEGDASFGLSTAKSNEPATSQPSPTAVNRAADAKIAVEEGKLARQEWEAWLAQMHGVSHDGASFAANQHLVAMPVPCEAMRAKSADFVTGCTAAAKKLASSAVRLSHDADFRAGWMTAISFPTEVSSSTKTPPPNPPTPSGVIAEFQGAVFCTGGSASLLIRIMASSEAGRQRAVVSFGPTATNSAVPPGSFIAEGSVALGGGSIDLQPVSWVSQPQGRDMLGLTGASEDGGRTYAGRIIATGQCSNFTMRRKN